MCKTNSISKDMIYILILMGWVWIWIDIFFINGKGLRRKKYLQIISHCKSLKKYRVTLKRAQRSV